MKRIILTVLLGAMLLCACGKTAGAEVSLGESQMYSEAERQQALDKAMGHFRYEFDGCELQEIHYSGDDRSREASEEYGKEMMVFTSRFYVEEDGGDGSLEQDSTYSGWIWLVQKTEDGKWKYYSCGY